MFGKDGHSMPEYRPAAKRVNVDGLTVHESNDTKFARLHRVDRQPRVHEKWVARLFGAALVAGLVLAAHDKDNDVRSHLQQNPPVEVQLSDDSCLTLEKKLSYLGEIILSPETNTDGRRLALSLQSTIIQESSDKGC